MIIPMIILLHHIMILNSVLKKSVVKKHHILKYTIINITELYRTLTWVPCNMLLTKIKTDSNVIFFMYSNVPSIIPYYPMTIFNEETFSLKSGLQKGPPSSIHSHLIQISLKHPIYISLHT